MNNQKNILQTGGLWVFLILSLLCLALYAGSLNAPFYFDDHPNITQNPHIRITALSFHELIKTTANITLHDGKTTLAAHRPLPQISFALNYFFHAYETTGYHLVNMAIHVVTAFLVFLITRQVLFLCNRNNQHETFDNKCIPFFASVLWMINPVHIQSVTYIVQRMTSMAALFYLLSLWLYITARRIQIKQNRQAVPAALFSAAVISGLMAFFSKQIAATLPFFIFFFEWYFFQNLQTAWLKKQRKWIGLAISTFILLGYIYTKGKPLENFWISYTKQNFTLQERLLSEPGIVIYYLSLLFYPHPDRLHLDYDFPLSTSFFSPSHTTLAIIALLGLLIAGWTTVRKHRLLSFAIFWFLGNLAIESSFIGLALIYEHRTYLPSIFPVIALVSLLPAITTSKTAKLLVCFFVCLGCFWTYQRNTIWQDHLSFWRDIARKSPGKARPHANLAVALEGRGQLAAAIRENRIAIQLAPTYAFAHLNLGTDLISAGEYQKGIGHIKKALAFSPKIPNASGNLGLAYLQLGKIRKAILSFKKELSANPQNRQTRRHLRLSKELFRKLRRESATLQKTIEKTVEQRSGKSPEEKIHLLQQAKAGLDRVVAEYIRALSHQPGFKKNQFSATDIDIIQPVLEKYCTALSRLENQRLPGL